MGKRNKILIIVLSYLIIISIEIRALDLKEIYESKKIVQDINQSIITLHNEYKEFTVLDIIGYSTVEKTPIYALKIGNGEKTVFINGAHHGRESMTAILCLGQIERLCKGYEQERYHEEYTYKEILDEVAIVYVPLVNPDGVDLAMNKGKASWKANGRDVDLNKNYLTQKGKQEKEITAFSENETQAIKKLCEEMMFETIICYHSAGEVVFWWWYQEGETYDLSVHLLEIILSETRYKDIKPNRNTSGLGLKDWFVEVYNRPGFTIEIGKTVNQRPLKWGEFEEIWKRNKNIPIKGTYEIAKVYIEAKEIAEQERKKEIEMIIDSCNIDGITFSEYETLYIERYLKMQ